VQRLKLRLYDKSPKTINNVLSVFNVLMKQAVEWGVVLFGQHALFDPARAGAANRRGVPRLR
jgi:hypothetical protein